MGQEEAQRSQLLQLQSTTTHSVCQVAYLYSLTCTACNYHPRNLPCMPAAHSYRHMKNAAYHLRDATRLELLNLTGEAQVHRQRTRKLVIRNGEPLERFRQVEVGGDGACQLVPACRKEVS